MNKSDSEAVTVHRKTNASTTLNRKYVKRPSTKSAEELAADYKAEQMKRRKALAEKIDHENAIKRASKHPLQISAAAKMQAKKAVPVAPKKLTPKELKDQAIAKALSATIKNSAVEDEPKALKTKSKFSFGRVCFALACATVLVFAITYVVNKNVSDFSFRVSAMQSGIDATYPKYLPYDYVLSDITSEEGKITISFKNDVTGKKFSLSEERSSWDMSALILNYVKPEFGNEYTTIQKGRLTIYNTGNRAAWIHSGILYKLEYDTGSLTKNQITSLADSL